jgi:hypothetical protein
MRAPLMKIPEAFVQFVWSIYPEDPRESESLETLAAAAIEDSGGNDLRPVLAYLNELLDGGHSDAELAICLEQAIAPIQFQPRGSSGVFRRAPAADHCEAAQAGVKEVAPMSESDMREAGELRGRSSASPT